MRTSLGQVFRALRHRNYRLFFGGQIVSLSGSWMQQVATSWLVYRLTDSPFMLGLVGFVSNIPTLLIPPFAGLLADRFDKRKLLVFVQVGGLVQAGLLGMLVLTDMIQVWHLLVLGALHGVYNAFDMPIRQSFIIDMIEDPADLSNAIALNSTMFQISRLIGPSLAGILIAVWNEGACFALNALSFIPVILALMAMRIHPTAAHAPDRSGLAALGQGFAYAFGFPPIRSLLGLLTITSLVGFPYITLLPVFARDILGGDAHTLGFLTSAIGVGALIGTLLLAARRSVRGLWAVIVMAGLLFGFAMIGFAVSTWLWLSLVCMVLLGFGMMIELAAANTVLQTIVDQDKRGRVMSIYTMALRGTQPFGNIAAGSAASVIGAPVTLIVCGAGLITGCLAFATRIPANLKYLRTKNPELGLDEPADSTAALRNWFGASQR